MHNFSIVTPADWQDYKLIDSGDGEKLEQFGEFIISRPDPQILWQKSLNETEWRKADAFFERSFEDKGNWQTRKRLPEEWPMHWRDLTFLAKLSPFKHTGIFPEQSAHWAWFRELLEERIQQSSAKETAEDAGAAATSNNTQRSQQPDSRPNILNLFAYTGGASIVAAKTGARITHVDASRASIGWAKKNQAASGLDERSIRWILDDVVTFMEREARRGTKYDGIIMDPPVYGHGPNGEIWDFKKSLPLLLDLCRQVLSDKPLFVLINAYAVSTSAITLGNLLEEMMAEKSGEVSIGELAIGQESSQRLLSTGIWARWQEIRSS